MTDSKTSKTAPMSCGEATIRLLGKYGITTVFGIPGVHTLDFCRGLVDYPGIRSAMYRPEMSWEPVSWPKDGRGQPANRVWRW